MNEHTYAYMIPRPAFDFINVFISISPQQLAAKFATHVFHPKFTVSFAATCNICGAPDRWMDRCRQTAQPILDEHVRTAYRAQPTCQLPQGKQLYGTSL